MRNRIQITDPTPVVDAGRFAVKAAVGDRVDVGATVFREGHAKVATAVRYRMRDDAEWAERTLTKDPHIDRFYGSFLVDRNGPWVFQIIGWTDYYASWLDGLVKKHQAGQTDLEMEFAAGAEVLESHVTPAGVPRPVPEIIAATAGRLRDTSLPTYARVDLARRPDLLAALVAHPDRRDLNSTGDLPLWVDRERGAWSAWYEMFPRSVGAVVEPGNVRSGTFRSAMSRLPAIAAMGFDVLYLPPIHPIGRSHRKGANNTLTPSPDDPGVPWAIGAREGGHTAVHPDLGTLDDFEAFVRAAEEVGLEVALDYAIQCSPDHPWVTEHPEWFRHNPDGSIAYAENPPKKYQDIYPIDFDTPDIEGLVETLKGVLEFWIARGVKIFRVDNPHTKAVPFWEWVIGEIHETNPEVVFLAEAFTKPWMMHQLGKVGFTQSYTYFTWRTEKWELEEYLDELAHSEQPDFFRPNFWPNTPDILHAYLQSGSPAAFKTRATLAALTVPNWGMYSGYELLEHVPVRSGSEEYLDSEKYAYRPRDFDTDHSIAPFITRLNQIRGEFMAACKDIRSLWLHQIGNDDLMVFSRIPPDARGVGGHGRGDGLLVVLNLNQHEARDGWTVLDMWQLGFEGYHQPFEVDDLLTGDTWTWHGPHNWVRLDPHWGEPVHIFRIRGRG